MRHVYSASYRITNDDPRTATLQWYFVDDDTPFLPTASVFTSLYWVDKSERADDGVSAGELDGTQRAVESARPIGLSATAYCGTNDDWLGNGQPNLDPVPLDLWGQPLCCGSGEGQVVSDTGFSISGTEWIYKGVQGGWSDVRFQLERLSNWSYTLLSNLPTYGAINGPWTIDLLHQVPYGAETITDVVRCSFPGYATQEFYGPTVADNPDGSQSLAIAVGPFHFECSRTITGAANGCVGFVVCDNVGNILFWQVAQLSIAFRNKGDHVDVTFYVKSDYDSP